ncbi:hypothetical protein [Caminibacter pacificus]|uniref:HNH endonuclease n=1 Tax=Caminibacter pacificus TaxID=1424653 RepID=A0AAJ4UYL4_9BACT|nr:hypothetical protein [Caminibacter pacificus]ROR41002.1 hypothetical protein EDC58_0485 [Caminibacter pacificus]
MKKIVISEDIKKEFIKCLVNGNYKIDNFKLSEIEIKSNYIKIGNKKFPFLKNITIFLEKYDESILAELLLSDNIDELIINYQKNKRTTNINDEIVKEAYNSLRKKWGYKLIELTNTSVCPYCNRNYVFNFIKDKNKYVTTVELDHYYPKEKYPFLALNLYNLIPSCRTCNHKKRNDDRRHLHPFFDDIDKELKFSLKLINSNFYYSKEGFDIEINLVNNNKRAENHIDVFNLESIYKKHKDIVLELIQKKYMYNEDYLNELFKKYEGTFFKNLEDLMRLVSGGYVSDSEINKRPLSKLIKDISEELGII